MSAVRPFSGLPARRAWARVDSGAHRQRGVSLGIVPAMLIVVGALTVLGNALYGMRAERAQTVTTAERLELVVRGLTDFAILHKRLPCPAPGGDRTGIEARLDGGCDDQSGGVVPWRTLAIAETNARDRWGHAFSYRVADSLTTEASLVNPKADDALVLCLDTACTERRHDPEVGTGAAFVVIGHGEHAPGSFIADSGQRVAGPSSGVEKANLSAKGPFIDGPPSRRGEPADSLKYFDDTLRAVSISALRSAVTTGR